MCLVKQLTAAPPNCCSFVIHHKNARLFFYVLSGQKRRERLSEEQEVCVDSGSMERYILIGSGSDPSHLAAAVTSLQLRLRQSLVVLLHVSLLHMSACRCNVNFAIFLYPKGKLCFVALFCSGEWRGDLSVHWSAGKEPKRRIILESTIHLLLFLICCICEISEGR